MIQPHKMQQLKDNNFVLLKITSKLHKLEKQLSKMRKQNYQYCSGSFSVIAIHTNHGTGITIKLVHEVWLLLKYLIILSHKICSYLKKTPTKNNKNPYFVCSSFPLFTWKQKSQLFKGTTRKKKKPIKERAF